MPFHIKRRSALLFAMPLGIPLVIWCLHRSSAPAVRLDAGSFNSAQVAENTVVKKLSEKIRTSQENRFAVRYAVPFVAPTTVEGELEYDRRSRTITKRDPTYTGGPAVRTNVSDETIHQFARTGKPLFVVTE
jgi:hypothetical protein